MSELEQLKEELRRRELAELRAELARRGEDQPVAQEQISATPMEENSPTSIAASIAPRFNEGLVNVAGAPVDLTNFLLNLAGLGSDRPVGGSESLRAGLEAIGAGVGEEGQRELLGRDPTTTERVVGRISEEVGATIPAAALPFGAALRTAAAGQPATTAQRIGRSIVDPIRQAPGRVAAAETGLAVASGAGAATAQELAPGSTGAELVGQIVPAVALPTLAGATRGILRGSGTDRLNQAIADFEAVGTSPSVGQGTGNPSAQALEAVFGRAPGGVGRMQRVAEDTVSTIGARVNDLADQMAQDVDPEQAGRVVSRGLVGEGDTFLGRFDDVSTRLYGSVDELIPPGTQTPAEATQQAFRDLTTPIEGAENLSETMILNPQVRTWAEALQADLGETGTLPYQALATLRSAVGRQLQNSSVLSDAPTAELKRIYAAISSDIETAARAQSPQAARAFERANNFYRAGIDRIDNVIQPLVNRGVPEKVFAALERAGREGGTTIRRVYRSLRPGERNVVNSLILRRLGRSIASRQGAEGEEFSTETFLTNWNKITPSAKNAMFAGNPQMRRDLDTVARVAEAIREGGSTLANPSGTAGAAANIGGVAGALTGAGTLATTGDPTLLAGILGLMAGARGGAELFTNPRFVRWLARSTEIPAERIPGHIARLANTVRGSEEAAAVVDMLSQGLNASEGTEQ